MNDRANDVLQLESNVQVCQTSHQPARPAVAQLKGRWVCSACLYKMGGNAQMIARPTTPLTGYSFRQYVPPKHDRMVEYDQTYSWRAKPSPFSQ